MRNITIRCQYCQHFFAMRERCPHCARPGLFPNVLMAENNKERKALKRRYDLAVQAAGKRGVGQKVQDLEAVAASSTVVISRNLEETQRLAAGDNQGYSTFYKLLEAELRLPEGNKWDVLRAVTDQALFGDYSKQIRFAALSLDGRGLASYGECSWVLREHLIAHRASVFEENSVMFMAHHQIPMAKAHKLPRGYRATWHERSKLCIAKLADRVNGTMSARDFPELLLREGAKREDDEFVEVHVGGPMTARTLERVILMRRNAPYPKTLVKALHKKLKKLGVEVEN